MNWSKAGSELTTENPSRAEGLGVPHGSGWNATICLARKRCSENHQDTNPNNPQDDMAKG